MLQSVSRRLLLTGFGSAPFFGLSAAGFWEQKKYAEWSEKEVDRLMNDSPWAKAASGGLCTVRWLSSLPLKQAIAKARLGKAKAASEEVKSMLERETPVYTIALAGVPFLGAQKNVDRLKTSLKSTTVLNRRGKAPIVPQQVDVLAKDQVINVIFNFPKNHVITLDDKEVEFATEIEALVVRKTFKLKDMVFGGALSL